MYIAVRQGAILTEHCFFTDDIFNGDLGEFAKVGDILAFKQVVTSTNDTMIVEMTLRELHKGCFKVAGKPAIAFVNKDGFTSTPVGIIRNQCPPFMTIDAAKTFFAEKEQSNDTPNTTTAP